MKPAGERHPTSTISGPPYWRTESILLWSLLAIGAVLWRGRQFIQDLRPPETRIVDFFQEWASARNYFNGRPIYQRLRISLQQHLGMVPRAGFFIEHNSHPPTSVLLILPFGRLDYPDAVLVWNLVSLAAFAASGLIVVRVLQLRPSPWMILPTIALTLTAYPFLAQIYYAQMNMILLLFILGAWWSARSGRSFLAGVLLAVATALKLFPGFLFFYFLVRRDWRVLLSGALTILVLAGIAVAVFGSSVFVDHVRIGLPYLAASRSRWTCLSWPGFVSKLFGPVYPEETVVLIVRSPQLAAIVAVGGSLLCLAVLTWVVARAQSVVEQDVAFGASIVTALLTSMVCWNHYLLLLLLPVVLLWIHLPRAGVPRWVLILFLFVLWSNPWSWYAAAGLRLELGSVIPARPWQVLSVLSLHFYALVGVLCLCVRLSLCLRNGASAAESGIDSTSPVPPA